MRKSLFVMICVLTLLIVSVLIPTTSAETFKIGKKIDSDISNIFYPFTSEVYFRKNDGEVNISSLIFDGNLSTGINQIVFDNQLNMRLIFVNPLYINNITFLPYFGNGSSSYSFDVTIIHSNYEILSQVTGKRFLKINGFLSGIDLTIYPSTGNQYNFNDVIIDYTPTKEDVEEEPKDEEVKIFDIGEKVSESEKDTWLSDWGSGRGKWYHFSSGCMLGTKPIYIDHIKLILDGNESTGINQSFSSEGNVLEFSLVFPYTYYVNNITIKPNFGGNATEFYGNPKIYAGPIESNLPVYSQIEKTYEINGTLSAIAISLRSEVLKPYHFYFNDIIINYTPSLSGSNSNNVQTQIFNIYQDNSSANARLTKIENDIAEIKETISNLKNINTSNITNSSLQQQIDNLTSEINSLKDKLAEINQSVYLEYNDTAIKSSIFNIESENYFIKQNIGNVTIKIENLTVELEKLASEVEKLREVEGFQPDDNKSEDEFYNNLNNTIFGIIVIVLLLIILKLSMTVYKRKHQDNDVPETDANSLNKIKYDMLTNNQLKEARLYDGDLKTLLETRYQKGEMSQETYEYIRKVIAVSEDQKIPKKDKT